jgi:hypothetical protein
MRVGTTVLALIALVALAACTDATNSASGDPQSSSPPIASADNGTSVSKVSEALGQRLDGMLSGHPAAP